MSLRKEESRALSAAGEGGRGDSLLLRYLEDELRGTSGEKGGEQQSLLLLMLLRAVSMLRAEVVHGVWEQLYRQFLKGEVQLMTAQSAKGMATTKGADKAANPGDSKRMLVF